MKASKKCSLQGVVQLQADAFKNCILFSVHDVTYIQFKDYHVNNKLSSQVFLQKMGLRHIYRGRRTQTLNNLTQPIKELTW